ncbi:MAG: hypothetical protein RLZZ338_4216 [Cyanobacteriota bacterium]|jgi:signal transduction histidine kinase
MSTRSSIVYKIGWGYAVAIGVAVGGITLGLTIGNYLEKQRQQFAEYDLDSGIRLANLEIAILQARSRYQLLPAFLDNPVKFEETKQNLETDMKTIRKLIAEIQYSPDYSNDYRNHDNLQQLVLVYNEVVENYFQKLATVIQENYPNSLNSEDIPKKQKAFLEFSRSQVTLKVDNFSRILIEMREQELAEVTSSKDDLQKAKYLQFNIVIISIIASVFLAILFATYTSRAISRPIKELTSTAQKVTEEANFDLQVNVKTNDEIGILAQNFNLLVQEVKYLLEQQKKSTEMQLLQSEKMSSLGRMVAGIAHELNNPINFISGNLVHAHSYLNDLLEMLAIYQREIPQPPEAVLEKAEEIELDFLVEDFPHIIQSMKVGSERAIAIVLSLKDFSRLDEAKPGAVDIHLGIDSTLLILNNRIKKGVKLIRNYGEIPTIEGYTGQISQVFMNLLTNALDSLDENLITQQKSGDKNYVPEIIITTQKINEDFIEIKISDNGAGIKPENLTQIFEIFFTTKPRGVGTGLGLTITHQIITEKHHGKINCHSEVNQGTEFIITLPITAS